MILNVRSSSQERSKCSDKEHVNRVEKNTPWTKGDEAPTQQRARIWPLSGLVPHKKSLENRALKETSEVECWCKGCTQMSLRGIPTSHIEVDLEGGLNCRTQWNSFSKQSEIAQITHGGSAIAHWLQLCCNLHTNDVRLLPLRVPEASSMWCAFDQFIVQTKSPQRARLQCLRVKKWGMDSCLTYGVVCSKVGRNTLHLLEQWCSCGALV